MGCLFSSASSPVERSGEDGASAKANDGPELPDHLVAQSRDLLDAPVLRLGEAAGVLEELTLLGPKHFEAALGCEPFNTLNGRVRSEIVKRLLRTPSSVDVLRDNEGADGVAGLPSAPVQDASMEDGEKEAAGEEAATERPPVDGPLDGSTEEVPFDLPGLAEGLGTEEMTGQQLRRQIAAIALWDMALGTGLVRSSDASDLKNAAAKSGGHHIAWAEQRGAASCEGAGVIYGILAAYYLGIPDFDTLSKAYQESRGLPWYWDMKVHAAVCCNVDGSRRAAWYKLEGLLSGGAVHDKPLQLSAVEGAVSDFVDNVSWKQARVVIEGLLLTEILRALPTAAEDESAAAALQATAPWAAAAVEEEAQAYAASDANGNALRRCVTPVAWWDFVVKLGDSTKVLVLQSHMKTIEAVMAGHLKWSAQNGNGAILRRALFTADCILRGIAQSDEFEAGIQAAEDAYKGQRGLVSAWDFRAELGACGRQPEAWAALEQLMKERGEGEVTSDLIDAGVVAHELQELNEDGASTFVAECLKCGLAQVPPDERSIVAEFQSNLSPGAECQRPMPLAAWWAVAEATDVEEGVEDDEWSQCKQMAYSAAERILAWAVDEATNTGEVAPLRYALYGAAAVKLFNDFKLTDSIVAAVNLYQSLLGLPCWWDVYGEICSLGKELKGPSRYAKCDHDVWTAAKDFAKAGESGGPLLNAGGLPDRLEPLILDLESEDADSAEATRSRAVVDMLLEMMMRYASRLPRSMQAFVEEAQALESAFTSESSEAELQEAVEVTRIFCLFDGLMAILHGEHLARWQEKLAPEMIRASVTFMETAKSAIEQASDLGCEDILPLLRLALFVAFHLEARELEEFKALAVEYREKRGLPEGWDLRGSLSGDAPARAAWASAEALVTATEAPDMESAAEQLRTMCADGFRLPAAEAVCKLLAREYEDEQQVVEAYMEGVDDDSAGCYDGLKETIRCLKWWDLARELYVEFARELFFGGSSPSVLEASAKDAEMEASELSTRKLIAEIFKLLDADGDGMLNSAEHRNFAQLCGYTGGTQAWEKLHIAVCKQMGMSAEQIADNPGLSVQLFDRLVSSSEKFDKDALKNLQRQLTGGDSPGGMRRRSSSPRAGTIRRSGLHSPKPTIDKGDDDEIDEEIDAGGAEGNVDETKVIAERLAKARMTAAEWHLSWAMGQYSEKADTEEPKFLSIVTRRGILAANCLGIGALPAVKRLAAAYRKVNALPDFFNVQEAVAADKDVGAAWVVAEESVRSIDTLSAAQLVAKMADFCAICEERGVSDSARSFVGASVIASLLKVPVNMEKECKSFTAGLQEGLFGQELRGTISAVAIVDQCSSLGFADAVREDGQALLSTSFISAVARRHLLWSQSKVESLTRDEGASACRYALFATHCLCSWAKAPFPTQFGNLARTYCSFEQWDIELSSVRSLLVAYENGALAECLKMLDDPEAAEVADRAEELLTPLVMPGMKRAKLSEGDKVLMPRYEQIEAASLKAGLARSLASVSEKQQADWERIAGTRCEIVDFYDRRHPDAGDVVRVRAQLGIVVTVGLDVLLERILDSAVRDRICVALSQLLVRNPAEDEADKFHEMLEGEADSEELHNAVSAVKINDVILRLGHQVRHHKPVLKAREQCAQKYLVQGPSAKPGSLATLQLGLFVGHCMGLRQHAGFQRAANSYRQLKGLPDYWNVEEMAAAYDGESSIRCIWQRAEAALAGVGDGGAPDADAVQALLAEEPDSGTNQEPWKALKKLVPSAAPAYWDHAGFFGQFDEMVAVAKHDPLGRPTDIYAAVQNMLDQTWKPIATRDRPCPKGTCKPTAGGCPCVQKGGDPGMPSGIRVRRILRNEDSKRWQQYLDRREKVKKKRRDDAQPRLTSKPTPHLGDTRYFDKLDDNVNEMYLLHGTFVRAALSISQTGFAIDLAGSSVGTMYGRGAYFTECSSKADEYSKDEAGGYYKGVFAVLICRICMGKPHITEEREEGARARFDDGSHDSTLGDREKSVNTYREFVVYDMNQVYPEYCVLYERLGKGYEFDGDAAHWGALRREISKVVMEVPVHWQNVHVNPNSDGFGDIYAVSRPGKRFLESMISWPKTSDGADWHVLRAHRLEDSKLWIKYLEKRKEHQLRGDGGCPKLSDSLDLTGIKSMLSSEQQIVSNVLAAVERPRCKFGERCFRKNRKHRMEFCHPGDREWDKENVWVSTPKNRPGLGEADIAAFLLESIDHTINEVFLWQVTRLTPDRLLEDGFHISEEAGMLDEHRVFYETAAECIDQEFAYSGGDTCSLLFCRVLCGTSKVLASPDDFNDVAEETFEGGGVDSVVARVPDKEVRMFAVLSDAHVYPEYIVQVCRDAPSSP
mmetsp:Transcript_160499/g.293193  ORF Transcript_160499/g.293193 Transcript_160499/m.293193 type:complete len:2357 (-) Transcript_160499:41-7111(-)